MMTTSSSDTNQLSPQNKETKVGVLGAGTIGCAVIEELLNSKVPGLTLCKVLVKDLKKERPIPSLTNEDKIKLFTNNSGDVLADPEIDLVIELMAGDQPALEYALEAIKNKKHYVTANKELMAKHGPQIFAEAHKNKVQVRLDATVGGGIPIINTMLDSLKANRISEVVGIMNGTTNYILSAMKNGQDYNEALQQAQELGYAEPDPTNDVEGIDTKYKISILSSLAFKNYINPLDVPSQGISKISSTDFHFAKKLNYSIKLLGIARCLAPSQTPENEKPQNQPLNEQKISIGVYPALISNKLPLSQVDGVTNAIQLKGHLIQDLLLVGPGAGPLATSSAVLGDALAIAKMLSPGTITESPLPYQSSSKIDNHSPNNQYRFYVRLLVNDEAGVIGQVGSTLAKHKVSLSSINQEAQNQTSDQSPSQARKNKATSEKPKAVLILLTHLIAEDVFEEALNELKELSCIQEIACQLRVFE